MDACELEGEIALMLAWPRSFAAETKQVANQHEYDLVTLYSQLRTIRPDVHIELGRGEGCSTLVAAMAIAANRHGRIVSFDLHEVVGHDLLRRLTDCSGVPIDTRVSNVQDLSRSDWSEMCKGSQSISVLVDAHSGTGLPVVDVLLPFLQDSSVTKWFVMFHDILKISDRILFECFSGKYAKHYPYVSPYPEYKEILPFISSLNLAHFGELGISLEDSMSSSGVRISMPSDRASVHTWRTGAGMDEISRRFGVLKASSMLSVAGENAG